MSLRLLTLILTTSLASHYSAAYGADDKAFDKEVFKDDFSSGELGKAWKLYKAQSKIVDGVLIGEEETGGGHAAVHGVIIEPIRDLEIALSFRLSGAKNFSITFNDKDYKGSHAGHISRVQVTPK